MKTKTFNSKEVAEIFELEIVDRPLSNTMAGSLCKTTIVQTLKESLFASQAKRTSLTTMDTKFSDKDIDDVILRSVQALLTQNGVFEISNLSNMTINYNKRLKNKSCNMQCKKCNFIEIILHI
jgi:hypothetical protein